MKKYKLDGHRPVLCDLEEWSSWYENADRERVVGKTQIGEVKISTVFLAIDHNWSGVGRPVLFETMIFGGPLDQSQWRYSSWEEAEVGHANAVEQVLIKSN
ncbi:MAG: hypothetical protein PHC68_09270 [Syntrophorhabdaceae bacterium]|nr:hypothetical protein [Syntrophorhabdaceae bacterium]